MKTGKPVKLTRKITGFLLGKNAKPGQPFKDHSGRRTYMRLPSGQIIRVHEH